MRERDYHICKVEMPMYERYDKAVENNDAEELAWFAQFGTEKWENLYSMSMDGWRMGVASTSKRNRSWWQSLRMTNIEPM